MVLNLAIPRILDAPYIDSKKSGHTFISDGILGNFSGILKKGRKGRKGP
jgi:hypothetical protein